MKYYFIISIMLTLSCLAQELDGTLRIDYKEVRFSGNIVNNYSLYFDQNNSVYIEKQQDVSKEKSERKNQQTTVVLNSRSNNTPNFYYRSENDLFCRIVNYSESLLMSDVPYTIDWNISYKNEMKIEGYLCKKATATFRGNNYEVWFTTEIPTSFGPWKLYGLAGAILQAKTDNDVIKITASKIKKLEKHHTLTTYRDKDFSNALSYSEYRKKVDELADDYLKKLSAKMPKGTKPLTIDKNCKDCSPRLETY